MSIPTHDIVGPDGDSQKQRCASIGYSGSSGRRPRDLCRGPPSASCSLLLPLPSFFALRKACTGLLPCVICGWASILKLIKTSETDSEPDVLWPWHSEHTLSWNWPPCLLALVLLRVPAWLCPGAFHWTSCMCSPSGLCATLAAMANARDMSIYLELDPLYVITL